MIKTSITLQELRRKIYIKVKAMISDKPDVKLLGKRSALNAHAAFDEAGGGNIDLNLMRHCSTLPVRSRG